MLLVAIDDMPVALRLGVVVCPGWVGLVVEVRGWVCSSGDLG